MLVKHTLKKSSITHIIPAHPVFSSMNEFWISAFHNYDITIYLMKSKNDFNEYKYECDRIHVVEYKNNKELASKILSILKSSKVVFLHSIFFTIPSLTLLLLKGIRKKISKIAWIEWGFDLYYWDSFSVSAFLKSIIKKTLTILFHKKIPYFIAIHPADIRSYHKIIKGNALVLNAPYAMQKGMSAQIESSIKITMKDKIQANSPISIQIGHRADHILNHKDTLRILSRFADKNIRIYLPLCYGDHAYALEIEHFAKDLFGDKVVCQKDILSYDDYISKLESIDIFILNSKRQIALGNLHPMMVMGKKIVIPRKSVLYDFYGDFTPIMQYENLKTCSFEELIQDVDMKEARQRIIEMINIDPVQSWETVFNAVLNNTK